jgi:hypothetical protein
MEDEHLKRSVEDGIYLVSCLLENQESKKTSSTFFPFDHLYKK